VTFDLGWAFRNFQDEAWRLCALPAYDVPEEAAAVQEWWRTGVPGPRLDGWLDTLKEARSDGRTIRRRHALSDVPTAYERFALATYQQNAEAGEDVQICSRAALASELGGLLPMDDFWLFDQQLVAVQRYTASGRWLHADDETASLATYLRVRDVVDRLSVPIDEWVARVA
jgi:hypothetical protein